MPDAAVSAAVPDASDAPDAAAPLALGPELTIPFAAVSHEVLAAALQERPGDLLLDLGSVTDFDSAGVQLLLALQRSLRQRGDALHIVAAGEAVRDALAVFGLQALLPVAAPATSR